MKRIQYFLIGLMLSLTIGVAADSVIPSRLKIQQLTTRLPNITSGDYPIELVSAEPVMLFQETGVAADSGNWDIGGSATSLRFRAINDAFNSASTWLSVNRIGTTITTIDFSGTVRVGGVNVATQTSNAGVLTASALCPAATSTNYSYSKSGPLVTLTVGANSCTQSGANVQIFGGLLPTEVRPSVDRYIIGAQVVDNSVAKTLGVRVRPSGDVTFFVVSGTGITNFSGSNTLAWSEYSYTYAL